MSTEDERASPPEGPSTPESVPSPGPGRPRRAGPAARYRAEGKDYAVQLLRSAMTPLANDDGTPRRRGVSPYLPVLDACAICPARCCHLGVKLSLPDALRYASILGVNLLAGITLVPSTHDTHAFRVVRDPKLVAEEDGWSGRAELQLRRRSDGGCHALVDIGGYERCSVYEARPATCRLYPYSWTSDVARGSPSMIVCPVPFAVTERAERQFSKDVERSIEDWEFHDELVLDWHEAPLADDARTLGAFLSFALPRTATYLGVPLGAALDPRNASQRLYAAMIDSGVVRPRR